MKFSFRYQIGSMAIRPAKNSEKLNGIMEKFHFMWRLCTFRGLSYQKSNILDTKISKLQWRYDECEIFLLFFAHSTFVCEVGAAPHKKSSRHRTKRGSVDEQFMHKNLSIIKIFSWHSHFSNFSTFSAINSYRNDVNVVVSWKIWKGKIELEEWKNKYGAVDCSLCSVCRYERMNEGGKAGNAREEENFVYTTEKWEWKEIAKFFVYCRFLCRNRNRKKFANFSFVDVSWEGLQILGVE